MFLFKVIIMVIRLAMMFTCESINSMLGSNFFSLAGKH